jgi:paraquat-inducible protein B
VSKKVNTTLLGAFVTGAIVLLVVAIILFGGEGLFTKREQVIMYFDGSVDGLNVGAPVNVRGVQIGTVTGIDIQFNTDTGELRVPVIADIEADSIEQVRRLNVDDPLETVIVDLGLRAQLQIQSLLTSQLFIQLDYHPATRVNYYGDGTILEIPTIPMTLQQLDQALEDVSLEQMLVDISASLSALNRIVNSPDTMESITAMKRAFTSLDKLSRELHDNFVPMADTTMTDIQGGLADLNLMLQDIRQLVAQDSPQIVKLNTALDEISNASRMISRLEDSPQMRKLDIALEEISGAARTIRTMQDTPEIYNLNEALEEISAAARALQRLADTLERQPEALLQGKSLREQ